VISAALPSGVEPKTKEMVWSDLYPPWSLTGIPSRMHRMSLDLRPS
jgi:hypothetical protein